MWFLLLSQRTSLAINIHCLSVVESTFFHATMAGYQCPTFLLGYSESRYEEMGILTKGYASVYFVSL
jgi:hypothetical protein